MIAASFEHSAATSSQRWDQQALTQWHNATGRHLIAWGRA